MRVFFDYAKGDVADDADFVAATRTEVVRLPEESLPLNPFSRVNAGSETNVKVAAQEFADLIRDVERRLGTVQAQLLYDAILERLIREIRSKGASVFLMSQSPDDYNQDNFDFTELLEFIFLLQSNAGASRFLQNAFGISAQEAKTLSSEVANLPTANAIGKSYDKSVVTD